MVDHKQILFVSEWQFYRAVWTSSETCTLAVNLTITVKPPQLVNYLIEHAGKTIDLDHTTFSSIHFLQHSQKGHSSGNSLIISVPERQTDPRCRELGNSFCSPSNHTLWQLSWEIYHLISLLLLWALMVKQIIWVRVLLSVMSTSST